MFLFLRPHVEFSRRITTQAVRLWCLSHWTSFLLLGFVTSRSLNKMILTIKRKLRPRESKQRKESTVHKGFQSWQKVLLKKQKLLKVIRTGISRPAGCICKLQNINNQSDEPKRSEHIIWQCQRQKPNSPSAGNCFKNLNPNPYLHFDICCFLALNFLGKILVHAWVFLIRFFIFKLRWSWSFLKQV